MPLKALRPRLPCSFLSVTLLILFSAYPAFCHRSVWVNAALSSAPIQTKDLTLINIICVLSENVWLQRNALDSNAVSEDRQCWDSHTALSTNACLWIFISKTGMFLSFASFPISRLLLIVGLMSVSWVNSVIRVYTWSITFSEHMCMNKSCAVNKLVHVVPSCPCDGRWSNIVCTVPKYKCKN